jgi:hypothetical protein
MAGVFPVTKQGFLMIETAGIKIYTQESEFLDFCHCLLTEGRIDKKRNEAPAGFTGLSEEGQKYLADLLARKATQYVLEKGGTVPGIACRDKKRINEFSLLSHPFKWEFSAGIIDVLDSVFQGKALSDITYSFSAGDNCILLYLVEISQNQSGWNRLLSRQQTEAALSKAFLPRFFFLHCIENDIGFDTIPARRFIEDEQGLLLLHSLRFFYRDTFIKSFHEVIDRNKINIIFAYGSRLQSLTSFMFDLFLEKGCTELFESYCMSYEMLFNKEDHVARIETMIQFLPNSSHASGREQARRQIFPLYAWVKRIDEIRTQAQRSRPWDDDAEAMNVFKKYSLVISKRAQENARKTVEYLEGTV